MLDNKLPFTRRNLDDEDDLAKYIAQIHAVLGPPPEGFLKVLQDQPFWDEEGSWIHSTIALPETSLMQKLESLEESERLQTADFLLCMLKWLPTKRCTAEELLGHPWLTSLFG